MADVAIRDGDRVFTHAGLARAVERVAREVAPLGRGALLALWLPNGAEILVAVLACLRVGVVPMPLHHGMKPPEVAAALAHARPRALWTTAALAGTVAADVPVRTFVLEDADGAGGALHPLLDPSGAADDPALALHTSGTKGRPRAVVIPRRAVDDVLALRLAHTALGPDCVAVVASCLSQSVGLYQSLAMLAAGGTVVVLPDYDADRLAEAVNRHRPTHLMMVVDAFDRLLHHPAITAASLASLVYASVGADRVTARVQERFIALAGRPLRVSYGLTESSWALLNPGTDPARCLALGLPAPGASIALRDGDRDVAPGQTGEILVRSPRNLLGYLHDDAPVVDADGWLRTGDLAWQDADGWYWFAGRCKDVIVLPTGDNVSPIEVADALQGHPAVTRCAVAGVAAADGSEEAWAWVTATGEPSEAALRAWLGERLSDHKVPSRILVVDALPVGLTGKVRPAAVTGPG